MVILDGCMPHLDGIAATAEIKRRWPSVRVVVTAWQSIGVTMLLERARTRSSQRPVGPTSFWTRSTSDPLGPAPTAL
ncbi:MAG: hypothetical protein JO352_34295 [Chloroflexi bacterium]|nr:hypothetical protein [Chloroflexota bacterium]MBV9601610.1 hypothetical protein [Chloroflexota bacterium]